MLFSFVDFDIINYYFSVQKCAAKIHIFLDIAEKSYHAALSAASRTQFLPDTDAL